MVLRLQGRDGHCQRPLTNWNLQGLPVAIPSCNLLAMVGGGAGMQFFTVVPLQHGAAAGSGEQCMRLQPATFVQRLDDGQRSEVYAVQLRGGHHFQNAPIQADQVQQDPRLLPGASATGTPRHLLQAGAMAGEGTLSDVAPSPSCSMADAAQVDMILVVPESAAGAQSLEGLQGSVTCLGVPPAVASYQHAIGAMCGQGGWRFWGAEKVAVAIAAISLLPQD